MTEKEIKIQVIDWLHKNEKHSVIVPEVTISNKNMDRSEEYVRADILALNGSISIYEIKSQKDTLDRLPHQISKYIQYANKVSVVIDEKFLNKLILPDGVGIYITSHSGIEKIKSPIEKEISIDSYLRYWWGIEFKKALRGFPKASNLWMSAAEKKFKDEFSHQEIRALTIFRLKERYLKESKNIKDLINRKKYDDLFPKRVYDKNIKVTPIVDIPFGVLKGVTEPRFILKD